MELVSCPRGNATLHDAVRGLVCQKAVAFQPLPRFLLPWHNVGMATTKTRERPDNAERLGPGEWKQVGEWDDLRYAAEMEARQLHALELKLDKKKLCEEASQLERVTAPRLGKTASQKEIHRWLKNGWNTERLLRLTGEIFDQDALQVAIQWSFPMAYYSVFATTSAFFGAASYTEKTHASVIKRFGVLAVAGKYPKTLSFVATGARQALAFHAIQQPLISDSTIRFDANDPETIGKHICQFLRATREQHLIERAKEMRFLTKQGKPKSRLSQEEWGRVSKKLGPTSLLSLLYRKRIKAHYRQIDTFSDTDVDADQVFRSLAHIVDCANFTHETLVAAAIGLPKYKRWVGALPGGSRAAVRVNTIEQVLP